MTRFVKELAKKCLYQPFGVRFGARSFIRRPFKVMGRNSIVVGSHTSILGGAYIHAIVEYAGRKYTPAIEIGNGVYIGRHAFFTAVDRMVISDGCVLSDYVYLTDEVHGMDPQGGPIMERELESKGPVVIGANCFLGYRVSVLPGVSLGEGCIVGAGSTVTRSFPPFSMIAGSPARLLKTYSHTEKKWLVP